MVAVFLPERKERRYNVPCLLRRNKTGRLTMCQISKWGLIQCTPIACRMPPCGPAALNPLPSIPCLLLFHAPTCLHTLAPNGHERLRISDRHCPCAHSCSQKSRSNPAFPCSASRIKAFPSSRMKLPDSLYREADRRWFTQGVSFRTGHQTG